MPPRLAVTVTDDNVTTWRACIWLTFELLQECLKKQSGSNGMYVIGNCDSHNSPVFFRPSNQICYCLHGPIGCVHWMEVY